MEISHINNLKNNIPKIYAFSFFTMFLILIPVLVPFFTDKGLNMEEILVLQSFFGVVMALFEVPSAYLGDLIGRKTALVLGSFITGIGFSSLIYIESFWGFMLYEGVLAVGMSFISGADLSILYDSTDESRAFKAKLIGKYHSKQLLGESMAAICCSFLVAYGMSKVLYGQMIVGWIPFLIALTIKEAPIEKMNTKGHFENIKMVFSFIFKENHEVRIVFIMMTLWSLSTFCAVWIQQKYWMRAGLSNEYFGALWAMFHIIAALSAHFAVPISKLLGLRRTFLMTFTLPVIAYITMGVFESVYIISICTFFYVSRGFSMVLLKEKFNHHVPGHFRNTANSLSSLSFRLGFFLLGPLVGLLIDRYGLSFGLMFLGTLFFLCFLLSLKHIKHLLK